MENRSVTCCFTGHRTVPARHRTAVIRALQSHIETLSSQGITRYIAGGALGFDTLAALTVLQTAEKNPSVRLILAIPCLNQTEKWNSLPNSLEHLRLYKKIMGLADEVIYTSEQTYFDGCMKIRNQYMVDHASMCIAYWNGRTGGTSQTVRMAKKAGLPVINLYDEVKDDIQWCDDL